jgi:hypothetical protein
MNNAPPSSGEPLDISPRPMAIGFVYFLFLPSMFTTSAAGGFVRRFGSRITVRGGLAVALAGLPLLIASSLASVAAGLMLVGVGTFFARGGNRIHRPGRDLEPRRGEWPLSHELFQRRACGDSSARPDLRSVRLGSLRPRHGLCACGLDGLCNTDESRSGGQILSMSANR